MPPLDLLSGYDVRQQPWFQAAMIELSFVEEKEAGKTPANEIPHASAVDFGDERGMYTAQE